MRKYQQLLLLLVSCCSVAVLLMYKSENNRLKYVLKVVNFFGRSDAANAQEQLAPQDDLLPPDLVQPLPVWQAIDDANFHAYSTYWNRNELMAGGEAIAIVAGKRGAVINFRCALQFDYGTRSVQGKFRFQRLDAEFEDAGSDFTTYVFYCRTTRDFGQPESVTFSAIAANVAATHSLQLRYVREATLTPNNSPPRLTTTVCLNLVGGGGSNQSDAAGATIFARDEHHMLQFFLHHHRALGVEHFLVYNADALPRQLPQLLSRHARDIQLHRLPFNFPFGATGNITSAARRLRRIVETDCLMRNMNVAHHTLLLGGNEFLYANTPTQKQQQNGDRSEQSLNAVLRQFPTAVVRFELPTFSVCVDAAKPLLVDSTMYDPEAHTPHRLFVYRPHVPQDASASTLALSQIMAHRYVDCLRPGKDGLHEWRGSLREDFLRNLDESRNEVATFVQPSAVVAR